MLRSLDLEDFTVFDRAKIELGALNVIHGENSSGKSHLLRLGYTLAASLSRAPNSAAPETPTKAFLERAIAAKLSAVFRPDQGKVGRLARRVQGTKRAKVKARHSQVGSLEFEFSTRNDSSVRVEKAPNAWLEQAPIFFPTRELLSVYPGFVSLYETQAVPFDETWRDTCVFLGAPVARGPRKREIAELLGPLEKAIGCKAVLEGDRFFLQMQEPRAKVEADLVAEGYRKLSMVARLIANGSLDDKGLLFWDEPEANLNPRLVKRLAPLLLDLAAGGVQVFAATHSLFLMREIEIERAVRAAATSAAGAVDTRYIGLFPHPDGVAVEQGPSIEDAGDIVALDENLQQSDRYLALGG